VLRASAAVSRRWRWWIWIVSLLAVVWAVIFALVILVSPSPCPSVGCDCPKVSYDAVEGSGPGTVGAAWVGGDQSASPVALGAQASVAFQADGTSDVRATVTIPPGTTRTFVRMWGGGGGGGGGEDVANTTESVAFAGSGGGGAYAEFLFNSTGLTSIDVTVGGGGDGGDPNTVATKGGDTIVKVKSSIHVVAGGGGPGVNGATFSGCSTVITALAQGGAGGVPEILDEPGHIGRIISQPGQVGRDGVALRIKCVSTCFKEVRVVGVRPAARVVPSPRQSGILTLLGPRALSQVAAERAYRARRLRSVEPPELTASSC